VPPRQRPDEETLSAVMAGRRPLDSEVGNDDATLIVRAIPLRPTGEHLGALVLLRDVTDLRRRDRELVTKDATIREVHHRVKNNLQTVAALLRLQARRMHAPEARAALEEAVRRVGSIAIVHETLSQTFDESVAFDEVADRLRLMVTEVGAHGSEVVTTRQGSFGMVPADTATPLAMVVTELLQNALEHAFPHRKQGDAPSGLSLGQGERSITLTAQHMVGRLRVTVEDNGRGLPEGFDLDASTSLGLSIVRTLVESELEGILEMGPRPGGGTRVVVDLPAA
jgi:two-component system, sensor histidine kinase PdtaS